MATKKQLLEILHEIEYCQREDDGRFISETCPCCDNNPHESECKLGWALDPEKMVVQIYRNTWARHRYMFVLFPEGTKHSDPDHQHSSPPPSTLPSGELVYTAFAMQREERLIDGKLYQWSEMTPGYNKDVLGSCPELDDIVKEGIGLTADENIANAETLAERLKEKRAKL